MTNEPSADTNHDFEYYHVLVFDGADLPAMKVTGGYVIVDTGCKSDAEKWAEEEYKSTTDKPKVRRLAKVEAQEVRLALASGAQVACVSGNIRKELTDERIARRPTASSN